MRKRRTQLRSVPARSSTRSGRWRPSGRPRGRRAAQLVDIADAPEIGAQLRAALRRTGPAGRDVVTKTAMCGRVRSTTSALSARTRWTQRLRCITRCRPRDRQRREDSQDEPRPTRRAPWLQLPLRRFVIVGGVPFGALVLRRSSTAAISGRSSATLSPPPGRSRRAPVLVVAIERSAAIDFPPSLRRSRATLYGQRRAPTASNARTAARVVAMRLFRKL